MKTQKQNGYGISVSSRLPQAYLERMQWFLNSLLVKDGKKLSPAKHAFWLKFLTNIMRKIVFIFRVASLFWAE